MTPETVVFRIRWVIERSQYYAYDLPASEIYALPESDPRHLLSFRGVPKLPHWSEPPIYVPEPRLERPDIWHLAPVGGLLVMDAEVIDLLEPFVSASTGITPGGGRIGSPVVMPRLTSA